MALINITFTEEDVRSIANADGVPFDMAIERAASWAKHVEETATTLCNEQLSSAIRKNEP